MIMPVATFLRSGYGSSDTTKKLKKSGQGLIAAPVELMGQIVQSFIILFCGVRIRLSNDHAGRDVPDDSW